MEFCEKRICFLLDTVEEDEQLVNEVLVSAGIDTERVAENLMRLAGMKRAVLKEEKIKKIRSLLKGRSVFNKEGGEISPSQLLNLINILADKLNLEEVEKLTDTQTLLNLISETDT